MKIYTPVVSILSTIVSNQISDRAQYEFYQSIVNRVSVVYKHVYVFTTYMNKFMQS